MGIKGLEKLENELYDDFASFELDAKNLMKKISEVRLRIMRGLNKLKDLEKKGGCSCQNRE